MLTGDELQRAAAATGFQAESLETVGRLLDLLESLFSHPFLKDRLVLKGGTALNLFVLDLPRLSVDADLNYTGAADRETMLDERPKIEQAITAVSSRLGLQLKRVPDDHAGGKWRLSYQRASGQPGALELDVNFLLRTPLWGPSKRASISLEAIPGVTGIPMVDLHELAAGKLAALFSRSASRDAFDAREILRRDDLDRERLRLGFVVYGGANRRDWRTVSVEDLRIDPKDVDRQLSPVLRADLAPRRTDLAEWCDRLLTELRGLLSAVVPLEPGEIEFLTLLNDRGEIAPELLVADEALQEIIRAHPALRWKALNVREHKSETKGGKPRRTRPDRAGDT